MYNGIIKGPKGDEVRAMSWRNKHAITCCFNCEDRKAGCHSTCEKYITEKKAWNEEKAKIEKNKNKVIQEYVAHSCLKSSRRHKKRR